MYNSGFDAAMFAGLGIILVIGLIVGIAFYVLMALGLYRMAENKGIDNPWLAWVPIGNLWVLGAIVETIDLGDRKFDNAGIILVVGAFVGMIPLIGTLLALAYLVVTYFVYFKLFKMYAPGKEVMYLVLSIIFSGIALPIIIFMIKDNTPVEV